MSGSRPSVRSRYHMAMGEFWGNQSGRMLLWTAQHAAKINDVLTLERINSIMQTATRVGWDDDEPTRKLAPNRRGSAQAVGMGPGMNLLALHTGNRDHGRPALREWREPLHRIDAPQELLPTRSRLAQDAPTALAAMTTPRRVHVEVGAAVRMAPAGSARLRSLACGRELGREAATMVLARCHSLQMLGVAARAHTAEMVDLQAVGDRAVEGFPREDVRCTAGRRERLRAPVAALRRVVLPDQARRRVAAVLLNPIRPGTQDRSAPVVAGHVQHGHALDPAQRPVRAGRDRGGLAASALAEAQRNRSASSVCSHSFGLDDGAPVPLARSLEVYRGQR